VQVILWPAVITLAITLLRLVGELSGWPRPLFNPVAGGGGALVGISWLPIVLGPWFAWKLSQQGKGPASAWKTAGLALVALLLAMGMFTAIGVLGLPPDPTPELQSAGPLARWLYIGLLPQMTIWIANTVLVGTLFGALVVAVAKPARRA